jgi:hypothetical protein
VVGWNHISLLPPHKLGERSAHPRSVVVRRSAHIFGHRSLNIQFPQPAIQRLSYFSRTVFLNEV